MLRIASQAMEEMIEHCRREYPNEACGYLAGIASAPAGPRNDAGAGPRNDAGAGPRNDDVATVSFPIRNEAASPTWYEMNPSDQIRAQKEMRAKGLAPLAVYHSHVATEAYPSPRDVERATAVQDLFDGTYVLVTLKDAGRPRARAFRIRDGHVQEEELVEG